MAFKHKFFDLDFRNNSVTSQGDTLDTFFQAHTIEWWGIGDNEVLFGTYDENNTAGATRFTVFDAGVDGIKGELSALNVSTNLANFVSANQVIKSLVIENRYLLTQYVSRA